MIVVLAGALDASRFLWRKRFKVFQNKEGLVKGDREEQKFSKDCFLTRRKVSFVARSACAVRRID